MVPVPFVRRNYPLSVEFPLQLYQKLVNCISVSSTAFHWSFFFFVFMPNSIILFNKVLHLIVLTFKLILFYINFTFTEEKN